MMDLKFNQFYRSVFKLSEARKWSNSMYWKILPSSGNSLSISLEDINSDYFRQAFSFQRKVRTQEPSIDFVNQKLCDWMIQSIIWELKPMIPFTLKFYNRISCHEEIWNINDLLDFDSFYTFNFVP